MQRKIFTIAIILFLIALGVGGYMLFFGSPKGVNQTQTGTGNPFGTFTPSTRPTGSSANNPGQNQQNNQPGATYKLPQLTKITSDPVAGATIIQVGTSTVVRYTDRATGRTFDFSLNTGQLTRSTNTTIPKIYESIWLNGSSTVLRYLDDSKTTIRSYSLSLSTPNKTSSTTPSVLVVAGTFLPDNISALASSPNGKQIFYMVSTQDNARGVIANPDGSKANTVFSSPFPEWLVQWPTASQILLTTKPTSQADGFLYGMTLQGSISRLLGNIPGLTTLGDPIGTYIAYTDSQPLLSLLNVKTGTTTTFGLTTFTDKCVWGTSEAHVLYCAVPKSIVNGSYPDNWYQGLVSFSDSFYRIDAGSTNVDSVLDPKNLTKENIDVENMVISSNDQYLVFMNKRDLSLWVLSLYQQI